MFMLSTPPCPTVATYPSRIREALACPIHGHPLMFCAQAHGCLGEEQGTTQQVKGLSVKNKKNPQKDCEGQERIKNPH
eukprot:m.296860 g.296860  ORF g.296860 m.296860 type:complete len:78 (-) comp16281_c0_seq1:112-345(-)